MTSPSSSSKFKLTHILFAIILAFSIRLMFLGHSLTHQSDSFFSSSNRHRLAANRKASSMTLDEYLEQEVPLPALMRNEFLTTATVVESSTALEITKNEESLINKNSSTKTSEDTTLHNTPFWIHGHLLIIQGDDFLISSSEEEDVSSSFLETLRNFLNIFIKEKKGVIDAIIFRDGWQDPLVWGRPNPHVFGGNHHDDGDLYERFQNFVNTLKKEFSDLKILVEVSSFLPRGARNGKSLLKVNEYLNMPQNSDNNNNNNNNRKYILTDSDINFIGETGFASDEDVIRRKYFNPLQVDRAVNDDVRKGEHRRNNGRLLNFDSLKVQEWAIRQLLPLMNIIDGFLVDCADDVLAAHSKDGYYSSIVVTTHADFDEDKKEEKEKEPKRKMKIEHFESFRHVTQQSYVKQCNRWFYDFGRKFARKSNNNKQFVTGSIIMRKDPVSGLYSNENIFGGASSVPVESSSFSLVVSSSSSSSSSRQLPASFVGLRDSFLAASHAMYSGVTVFGVSPAPTRNEKIEEEEDLDADDEELNSELMMMRNRIIKQQDFHRRHQQHSFKEPEEDSPLKDDEIFFIKSNETSSCPSSQSKKRKLSLLKSARASTSAFRWLQFSAMMPTFVSNPDLYLQLMEFEYENYLFVQQGGDDDSLLSPSSKNVLVKTRSPLEKFVDMHRNLMMMKKQSSSSTNNKNNNNIQHQPLLFDLALRNIFKHQREILVTPQMHFEAAKQALRSRLLNVDHIVKLPDDFTKHDAHGPDLFEQHLPSSITMWPANPHRIQIFQPLYWQFFVGVGGGSRTNSKNNNKKNYEVPLEEHSKFLLVAPIMFDFGGGRHHQQQKLTKKLVWFPPTNNKNNSTQNNSDDFVWYRRGNHNDQEFFEGGKSVEFEVDSVMDFSLLVFEQRQKKR